MKMRRRSSVWSVSLALALLVAAPSAMGGASATAPAGPNVDERPAMKEHTGAPESMHVPPSPQQSPGVSIRLEEIFRVPQERGGTVGYRLQTSGFPQDRTYTVVYTGLSTYWEPVVLATEIGASESGSLENLKAVTFYREDDDRGESLQIEVVADDGSVYAVDKVFPFPIEATDSACHVWAEVVTSTRESYFLWLDGFRPGEEVHIRSTDSCDVRSTLHTVGPDGRFMVGVLHCQDGGTAVFSASAQSCKVTLTYDYGLEGEGLRIASEGRARSANPS